MNASLPLAPPTSRRRARDLALRCALLLCLSGAGACNDTAMGDPPGDDSRNRLDAGPSPDGALPDGRVPGAGGDGDGSGSGQLDGGSLPDGGLFGELDAAVGDGGTYVPEIDVGACAVGQDDQFEISVPFVEGGFDVRPGPIDYGLAYFRDGDCKHIIDTAIVPSFEGAPEPSPIVDDCRTIREVSLASTIDGWFMAWTDNSADTVELFTVRLDDMLAIAEGEQRLRMTDNGFFERRPALAEVAGEAMLAWYEERAEGRAILTRGLGEGGTTREVIGTAEGRQPIELALAQVGDDHAALAWVEEVAERGVWLQALDASGAAVGGAVQMSDFAAPGSTVDIATRETDGAGVVYSIGIDQVSFEVRYRRLRQDASFWTDEIKLVSRPLQGKDAGLARLGGGYVVAYRAIPDGNAITEPGVRIVFVSRDGAVARDPQGGVVSFPVVPAARDGSQIKVKVSVEGQLLLAFVDGSNDSGNTLRLVRRRLDCGR